MDATTCEFIGQGDKFGGGNYNVFIKRIQSVYICWRDTLILIYKYQSKPNINQYVLKSVIDAKIESN